MEDFLIVSVWYHERRFVLNTASHPFRHNAEHHAIRFKYAVLYFVSSGEEFQSDTLLCLNMRRVLPTKCSIMDDAGVSPANKIDFMKMCVVEHCFELFDESYVLLMDFDCCVPDFDPRRLAESDRFIEPFFDPSIGYLKVSSHDSYIENYAVLVRRGRRHRVEFASYTGCERPESNSCLYAKWVAMIIDHYRDSHGFVFPATYVDLRFKNTFLLEFERGGSWMRIPNEPDVDDYDVAEPPVFGRTVTMLYRTILSEQEDEVKEFLVSMRRRGYDFGRPFQWSNKDQRLVNVRGCIADRMPSFDFAGYEFVGETKFY
ncbi:hypothetical protein AV955_gp078 [Diadromus pulchellus ascovirus 4a]|uniref:Complete DpAV4 genome n=1 Tax=Diadromus pulchellus ascovirus 4a TaxID=158683 RepID=F2NZ07_9VIRU|nr:hypothetical protein AV955_gp078 [Diadromus pulchellus ascovirus 4a]CCA61435.1 unnamed protein product [Diadromus pulchellus ascovirus 4a]